MAEQAMNGQSTNEVIQNYMDAIQASVNDFSDLTNKVVAAESGELDDLMTDLRTAVTQENAITTDALERYYAELTNMVYFMSEKIGRLSIFKDLSKAMSKEAYNNAYVTYSMEKDEKGKSVRTVNENAALADMQSKTQSTVESIYANAYGILKNKLDSANEMISTLKNILRRRVSEEYLNAQVSANKYDAQEFGE